MPRYTTRYMVRLIVLLMLVSIINVADNELLAPVADVVRRDLHMSDTQLGMVRSAVFLAALLGQFFWGPLSDRWVRKYVIIHWHFNLERVDLAHSVCGKLSATGHGPLEHELCRGLL